MIFITIIVISIYCLVDISQRSDIRPPSGYYPINHDSYWNMIGFSFFMFEGIGTVMPVMNACD